MQFATLHVMDYSLSSYCTSRLAAFSANRLGFRFAPLQKQSIKLFGFVPYFVDGSFDLSYRDLFRVVGHFDVFVPVTRLRHFDTVQFGQRFIDVRFAPGTRSLEAALFYYVAIPLDTFPTMHPYCL